MGLQVWGVVQPLIASLQHTILLPFQQQRVHQQDVQVVAGGRGAALLEVEPRGGRSAGVDAWSRR